MLGVEAESDGSSNAGEHVGEEDDDVWGELFGEEEIGDVTDLEAELGINADDLSSASESEEVFERDSKRRRTETARSEDREADDPAQDEIIEDIDAWSEIENDPTTAAEVRYPPEPSEPTRAERTEHEKTHLPYRSWCQVCVMAKGREDAHSETKRLR